MHSYIGSALLHCCFAVIPTSASLLRRVGIVLYCLLCMSDDLNCVEVCMDGDLDFVVVCMDGDLDFVVSYMGGDLDFVVSCMDGDLEVVVVCMSCMLVMYVCCSSFSLCRRSPFAWLLLMHYEISLSIKIGFRIMP